MGGTVGTNYLMGLYTSPESCFFFIYNRYIYRHYTYICCCSLLPTRTIERKRNILAARRASKTKKKKRQKKKIEEYEAPEGITASESASQSRATDF